MAVKDDFPQRMAALRVRAGLTQAELAKKIGVAQEQLSRYEQGYAKPRPITLEKIAKGLGVPSAFLADGASGGADALSQGALVDGFCKIFLNDGHSQFVVDQKFAAALSGTESFSLLRVDGNAMSPTLMDGDWALIDTNFSGQLSDGIYAIEVDGDVLIKRVQRSLGMLTLQSDNPDKVRFRDIMVPANVELHIIGKVVWRGGGV